MNITEYDEFYKWYKANERRFHYSQMTEVQIAYSAYLHAIEQSHKLNVGGRSEQLPCEHRSNRSGHSPFVPCICNDCGEEL